MSLVYFRDGCLLQKWNFTVERKNKLQLHITLRDSPSCLMFLKYFYTMSYIFPNVIGLATVLSLPMMKPEKKELQNCKIHLPWNSTKAFTKWVNSGPMRKMMINFFLRIDWPHLSLSFILLFEGLWWEIRICVCCVLQ